MIREMDKRRARVDRLITALREFREVKNSYGYQAGFFESQLLRFAADSEANTDQLIRDLQRAVKNT
jgi:hypothetical protein